MAIVQVRGNIDLMKLIVDYVVPERVITRNDTEKGRERWAEIDFIVGLAFGFLEKKQDHIIDDLNETLPEYFSGKVSFYELTSHLFKPIELRDESMASLAYNPQAIVYLSARLARYKKRYDVVREQTYNFYTRHGNTLKLFRLDPIENGDLWKETPEKRVKLIKDMAVTLAKK